MADFYATLGVAQTATAEEIKIAHRALVKQHHPDRPGGDAEKFRAVQEAYDTLSDAAKRAEYDAQMKDFPGSLLWKVFMGGATAGFDKGHDRGWQHFSWNFSPERGQDIKFRLILTFEEMCKGSQKQFSVTRRVVCPDCKGVGGEDVIPCKWCEGIGVKMKGKTREHLQGSCGVCNGKGKMPRKTCLKCAGSGLAPKEQRVKLTLPAGVQPDSMCDLQGYGQEIVNGPPGDLLVHVTVRPHEFFRRNGFDIHCVMKVNALRAILGGDVAVPTIHGERTLTIPAGTQDGDVACLKGEGIHAGDVKGDQNVRVRIVVPTLDAHEKVALTEMLIEKIVNHSPEAELEPLKEALKW